jgi:hypothetical protein
MTVLAQKKEKIVESVILSEWYLPQFFWVNFKRKVDFE